MIKKKAKKLIKKIIQNNGFIPYAGNLYNWPIEDSEFKEIFEMQKSFGWFEDNGPKIQRLYMLRNLILSVKGLRGDWAECGVFKGSSSLIMAEYNLRYSLLEDNFKVHLFDSFQGLSNPTKKDKGLTFKEGDFKGSLKEVQNNLVEYDCFEFHPGWIPNKFNEVADKNFSFVHIDVDLYKPIKESLEFFVPRMLKGGFILLDDYGCKDLPGAYKATNEISKLNNLQISKLPFGQAFIKI
tara:strand:+ start:2024 stop:2740 length:717 start_codon:yes stop_codon:yes gene_type:complete